jgi:hypothetical protein
MTRGHAWWTALTVGLVLLSSVTVSELDTR